MEGWKRRDRDLALLPEFGRRAETLFFFIIFVAVLSFESPVIVESDTIRRDVSALHGVSLPDMPLLRPLLRGNAG